MNTFGPLVDSGWLAAHLGDPRLRVIDFRWQVGQPGPTDPRAGHIPGAFSAPWGGNLDRAVVCPRRKSS